jgi:hypothetical protein
MNPKLAEIPTFLSQKATTLTVELRNLDYCSVPSSSISIIIGYLTFLSLLATILMLCNTKILKPVLTEQAVNSRL